MTQTAECLQGKLLNDALSASENSSEAALLNTPLYVYGHGPTRNPFYEEARAINATEDGGLLILTTPVNRGQKLLLMTRAGQDAVEGHVIRTRTLDTQTFEVEVRFLVAQCDFWSPIRGAKPEPGDEKRRFPRIGLPQGMTVAWEGSRRGDVSRVSSLSLGGLFIDSEDPAPAGDKLRVQFDIPSGTVRGQAVVRRSIKGRGMGVEFTALPAASRLGLIELLKKLLGDVHIR